MHSRAVTTRAIAPYPWAALDRVGRREARLARRARGEIGELDTASWTEAASRLLGAEVAMVPQNLVGPGSESTSGARLGFRTQSGAHFSLSLEPALVARVIELLLDRSAPLAHPDAPVASELLGAVAAFVVETTRQSGLPGALSLAHPPANEPLSLELTVLLDGQAYRAAVGYSPGRRQPARAAADLKNLGDLEIAVPLVTAAAKASQSELASLRVGDAWMPGPDGWLWETPQLGRCALAAPGQDAGTAVALSEGGTIVLGGDHVYLATDEDTMGDNTLTDTVLDTPLVVRVEVGSLSLTAREWSELRPGDVIESGTRLAEPVVLRVAGRQVARGELVDVEGELGIRILEVVDAKAEA